MKRTFQSAISILIACCFFIIMIPNVSSATSFYSKAETLSIIDNIESAAGMNKYSTVQGSCTDGKYAYFALHGSSTALLKYDINTWELKDKNVGISLGHANDMAYNSKAKVIVVANNKPDYKTITIVDPDTLKVKSSVKIELEIYSIAYIEKSDEYVVGISGGYDFAILDSNFNEIDKFKGINTGFVRQGCDCDDNYIYFAQSGSSSNIIVVYNYSGNHIKTITIDKSSEIENIFHNENTFYVTLHYYGNFVYRIGISDSTQIKYTVSYKPGDGDGKMESTTVKYGTKTKLSECSFKKSGYLFGGWIVYKNATKEYLGFKKGSNEAQWLKKDDIDAYELYGDKTNVAETTKVGNITLTAFWIKNNYNIRFTSDSATGYIEPMNVKYNEELSLPENIYTKQGYVFSGYSVYREYDKKYYGYKKDEESPRWLYKDDISKLYLFSENETVSKLTYDEGVVFTAQFKSAFDYDENKLTQYNGIDKSVIVPDNKKLDTISTGAFNNLSNMQELHVPSSVSIIESSAISNCKNLKNIYFNDSIPENFEDDSIVLSGTPSVYLVTENQKIFLGWCTDKSAIVMIKQVAEKLK